MSYVVVSEIVFNLNYQIQSDNNAFSYAKQIFIKRKSWQIKFQMRVKVITWF